MKRKILAILAVIAVFSMCFAGIVGAAVQTNYGFSIGPGAVVPTVNGSVAAGEYDTDTFKDFLYDGWTKTTSSFRCKYFTSPLIVENWVIEVLGDTTNDPGDYVKMSVDAAAGFGDPAAGGAAPTTVCVEITVTGTGATSFRKGTGTAWAAFADPVSGTDYTMATSVTGHRIYELYMLKTTTLAFGYNNDVRIVAYDATTGKTLMWPPQSNADVPDTWGVGTTVSDAIPEGLTIGLMLAVSSVAVAVSARYFKKPKI
jgi:hypothetical protein